MWGGGWRGVLEKENRIIRIERNSHRRALLQTNIQKFNIIILKKYSKKDKHSFKNKKNYVFNTDCRVKVQNLIYNY